MMGDVTVLFVPDAIGEIVGELPFLIRDAENQPVHVVSLCLSGTAVTLVGASYEFVAPLVLSADIAGAVVQHITDKAAREGWTAQLDDATRRARQALADYRILKPHEDD